MRFLIDIANFNIMQIIVFGCLSMGAYYFFAFDDGSALKQSISNEQNKIQQLEVNIKKKRADFESLKNFKKEVSSKEEAVSLFLNYIPNELSSIDIFSLLNNEAKTTGINIEDKQDQPSVKKEPYEILKIKLKVSGAFPQIVSFLSRLTGQKRMLIVDKIAMSVSANKKIILADLDIFAFRYSEKQTEEKKEGG